SLCSLVDSMVGWGLGPGAAQPQTPPNRAIRPSQSYRPLHKQLKMAAGEIWRAEGLPDLPSGGVWGGFAAPHPTTKFSYLCSDQYNFSSQVSPIKSWPKLWCGSAFTKLLGPLDTIF